MEVPMKKALLAGVAALAIAGSTAVYAQHRPWFHDHARFSFSPQDRTAFADARIAAVHAGLTLTPDQEKLWPPVEQAVRDFAKLRIDRANARMQARQDGTHDQQAQQTPEDPVARLRSRADRMGETAAALKKIADAADPLYKTLDDGQKRRLMILTRMGHRFGGEGERHHRFERGGEHFDRGGDRFDHRDRDQDGGRGPGGWSDDQTSGRL
jgi:hypothetical protein